MSRRFEALENAWAYAGWLDVSSEAAAPRPVAADAAASIPAIVSRVSMEEEMVRLHQHLNALLPDHAHRAIQFIGSCEGEGTSTVAHEFARVSAARSGQRVLLLEMNGHAVAASAGGDKTFDVAPLPQEFLAASHTTDSGAPAAAWDKLRTTYDLILVDSPPATTSSQGLAVSSQVDGVVLVLAAEDTRWPVAERVKQSIERSGGRLLGIVLNKRQYHIPQFIYRRL